MVRDHNKYAVTIGFRNGSEITTEFDSEPINIKVKDTSYYSFRDNSASVNYQKDDVVYVQIYPPVGRIYRPLPAAGGQ